VESPDAGVTPPAAPLVKTTSTNVGKPIAVLAVSTDGTRVAVGQVGALDIRDLSGTVQQAITVLPGQITAAAFSSDGSRLVGGGQGNSLQVWNVADGMRVHPLTGTAFPVRAVDVTSTGLIAASMGDNTVKTFDVAAGSASTTWNQQVAVLAFVDDAVLMTAGADGALTRVNAGTGGMVGTVNAHATPVVALVVEGGKVLSASQDGHVRLGEITGAELATWEVTGAAAVAWSATQNRALVGVTSGALVDCRMDGTQTAVTDSAVAVTALALAGTTLVVGRSNGTLDFYAVSP